MKKRLVFVNCPSPFLLDDRGAPPLGLLYLAAETRAAGFECQFVDLTGNLQAAKQLGCDLDLFVARGNFWTPELMASLDPARDIVALSVTSAQYHAALNVLFALKWEFGHIPVIIGGSHVSALPEEALQDGFDTVFAGEADIALIDWLNGGAGFKGIIHSKAPRDLDTLPVPARDLVDLNSYCANLGVGSGFATTVHASRGCPWNCAYCLRELGDLARVYRPRSPANVVAELESLDHLYGLRRFTFTDDVFGLRKPWLIEFCESVKGHGYHFRCNIRANYLYYDCLGLMADAGFKTISFGMESADDSILQSLSKNSVALNARAIRACQASGIGVKCYFIWGVPGDGPESAEKLKAFIEQYHPDSAQLATLIPLPATPLYRRALEQGFLPDYSQMYHNGADRKGGALRLPWWTDETLALRDELLAWLEAFYAQPQPAVECPLALSEEIA